jgi:tetratricopeptide (TPR) repeat protein
LDALRRGLLVLVTGLVVARPVVLGEDPGLLDNLSEPSGLVLTLLTFLAAIGWAVWRLLARKGAWYGGLVEVGLALFVGLTFLSAAVAARYKHPAWLIAWEMLGLLVLFFVVRQLAVSALEQRGLYAAFLATGVAIAAHAVYQYAIELPRQQERYQDREKLREDMARQNPEQPLDDASLDLLARRIAERNAFGPYSHPNSLAGYLALVLPGLVGAAFVCRRERAPSWETAMVAGCAALGGVALWMTHSRGALLAVGLVGFGAAAIFWRRFLLAHKLWLVVGLIVLAAAAFTLSGRVSAALGKDSGTAAARLEYWRTTWKMIEERPWLGVGPGNFGRVYTRFMEPDGTGETIKDPHNLVLEAWANSGVFAAVALLAALGAFFVVVFRRLHLGERGTSTPRSPSSHENPEEDGRIPWEFYLGGMVGLVLGFLLRVGGVAQTPEAVFVEGLAAGGRSLLWFPAFALLERVGWTGRGRTLALTAGVAALLLNLLVSGGISFPSVAGPLVIAMALGAGSRPLAWLGQGRAVLALPVPILTALAAIYLVFVFGPVNEGLAEAGKAMRAARDFQEDAAKPAGKREIKSWQAYTYVKRFVVGPLEQAVKDDPENARLRVLLAEWYGELWAQVPVNDQLRKQALQMLEQKVQGTKESRGIDPEGRAGYLTDYHLRVRFARMLEASPLPGAAIGVTYRAHLFTVWPRILTALRAGPGEAKNQYRLAARVLEKYLPNDPTDATLRYQLAEALFRGGETAAAREQAREALRLDQASKRPTRSLTDPQRKQLEEWLTTSPRS